MRKFNTPPGWPDPPTARWRPPKNWRPAATWPPAPDGWAFWVDERGRKVRGPLGRYGGPSVVTAGAIAAVPLALIALVLFNPFGGDESAPSGTSTTGPAPVPVSTPTASATEEPTTAPSIEPSQGPTATPPESPTRTPTPTSTQQPQSPTPTPTRAPTPTPTRTESVPTTEPTAPEATTAVVYQNCGEVRAAGRAPLHRGDPGYSSALDRNGDGVACDRGNS